jgi:uncharacterized protein YndB with AHSA1/START domain
MSETTTVSRIIPAPAERIFNAWLDAHEHASMTGAGASAGDDGAFTAWDGYISGRTVGQTPHRLIEQAWRTTEFPDGAPDSTLVVDLEEVAGGTRVTLTHTNIPDGQASGYEKGWDEYYFEPMTTYFTSAGSRLKEVGEAIGDAIEDAEAQLGAAVAAVNKTRKRATREAVKAVSAVVKAEKKVVARAKAVGRKVSALIKPKPGKAPAKKAGKKAPKKLVKKAAPRKVAKPVAKKKKAASKKR